MKPLQKNQGRTDQMLGAIADMLTSVALPNQQWVSRKLVLERAVDILTFLLALWFLHKHVLQLTGD